ncbi:hypothetical protein VTK73DRAFT_7778 [Phialemonium thermophilum]|uniref:Phytoene synthase n=1 Tax=Phialemonium thermophilum TaxID=223376 RepID=A0ABR3XS97_9PEZI
MYSTRGVRRGLQWAGSRKTGQVRRGIVTDADVEQARKYCVDQLRKGDYDAYLIRQFVPRAARDAYDALRTLNLELARLPETVSSPAIGRFRMQFWRDTVANVFAGNPPREPISILLHKAVTDLRTRPAADGGGGSSANALRFWLLRFLNMREQHLEAHPFPTLAALEDYAEHTYATLLYMTLAAMPVRSVHVDHLASHIGKATGIAAILRGIPILAAPSTAGSGAGSGGAGRAREPALLLPLDVMAETGVREEDVFRHGPRAEGLQDAVFRVATRAHDHILTAREMLQNLRAGKGPGHDYEHAEEAGPADDDAASAAVDVRRAFGILLDAVPTAEYLERLEAADFDAFRVKSSWKLPWRIWQALKKEQI